MAKKKNIYSKESIKELKQEIDGIIEYLETIDPEELTDDIDWAVTMKGVMPKIVCTKEETLKTALITVKDCTGMLLVIADLEGVSEYIKQQMLALKTVLESIRAYYRSRPIPSIEHRRLSQTQKTKPTKNNPSGGSRTMEFLVATKQRQISDRAMITKKVLEIIPMIEKLEEVTENVEFKGDAEIPPAFILLGLK